MELSRSPQRLAGIGLKLRESVPQNLLRDSRVGDDVFDEFRGEFEAKCVCHPRLPSNPRCETLVEQSKVVLVQRFSDHPIDLFLHPRCFVRIGVPSFELHSDATPHGHRQSVSLLFLLIVNCENTRTEHVSLLSFKSTSPGSCTNLFCWDCRDIPSTGFPLDFANSSSHAPRRATSSESSRK